MYYNKDLCHAKIGIKFLYKEAPNLSWSKRDKNINIQLYILYGSINLQGYNPLTIDKEIKSIVYKYYKNA